MIRQPAAAGMMYPKDKKQLIELIERCFKNEKLGPSKLPDTTKKHDRTGEIFGLIAPHAGYVYSGPIAAHAYLQQFNDGNPEFFVIIGPNHRNIGPRISVYPEGEWETPLGKVSIAEKIAEKLINEAYFRSDTSAHMMEHSLEVHVPFLQYLYGDDLSIVPICLKDQSKDMSIRVGNVISDVLKEHDYCMIASTDLTHYESHTSASSKDQHVIDAIKNLNANALYEEITEKQISMCGPGAVASILTAAHHNNVKNSKILKYGTSGEVSGNKTQVVGYVSAILTK
ncbi:MAG: AmmeMemoRadiSam system protein B [Asgard group archaeon]|nr:AmmeMemoRadiSam system protein B [Asgard group archaeon]